MHAESASFAVHMQCIAYIWAEARYGKWNITRLSRILLWMHVHLMQTPGRAKGRTNKKRVAIVWNGNAIMHAMYTRHAISLIWYFIPKIAGNSSFLLPFSNFTETNMHTMVEKASQKKRKIDPCNWILPQWNFHPYVKRKAQRTAFVWRICLFYLLHHSRQSALVCLYLQSEISNISSRNWYPNDWYPKCNMEIAHIYLLGIYLLARLFVCRTNACI